MKNVLLFIGMLFLAGCEFGIGYRHVHHTGVHPYDEVDVTYDVVVPVQPAAYPYSTLPDACYTVNGTSFCEWTTYGPGYSECLEIWYYDEYWYQWVLYDESCYAI